jgi:glycosyltransferase involved in cell wall biosynthesis
MSKTEAFAGQSQKVKIIYVVTASFVVAWHLDNTLKRLPDNFEVCVVGQDVSGYRQRYPNVTWVDIDLYRKISVSSDVEALFSLCRLFVRYKPDIVHSIMPKAGLLTALAGFLCRVPVRIHTFTGQVWATKRGVSRFFLYNLDKLINTLNTVCLTDSPSQSQFLYEHGLAHRNQPLPVLAKGSLTGVDLSRFAENALVQPASALRKELGLTAEHFVFAFIARKTRDKGALDMIRAFSEVAARHPECRLLFIGPDESKGELAALQQSQPALFNQVILVDRVENHPCYLAISQVLCLPSYREGFGTIVIDAAALGVPAIGSDIVGLRDAIEADRTGVLFSMGNIAQFTAAMLAVINHPDYLQRLGKAARQRVEVHFSADKLFQALVRFYSEQLQGH